jgi:hypothetical protein
MREEQPRGGDSIGPLDWLKNIPHEAVAASDRLGWVGLEAARYRAAPASEYNPPALTHHWFVLFIRPPQELELGYEGIKAEPDARKNCLQAASPVKKTAERPRYHCLRAGGTA